MAKRSVQEVWTELVDEAGEDAIARAAEVGVAEAEAELREAEFDIGKENAAADRLIAELMSRDSDRDFDPGAPQTVSLEDAAATDGADVTAGADRGSEAWSVETSIYPPTPRSIWLMAAGFSIAIGGLAVVKRDAIVAFFRDDTNHQDDKSGRQKEPSRETRAAAARTEAQAACARDAFEECEARLDEARGLDPAGEDKPEVASLRQRISKAHAAPSDDKPQRH
jgi:hypothetical protein